MSELPIVKTLEDLSLSFKADRLISVAKPLDSASTLIRELVDALEAARSQAKTLGTPDDAVNNHIIAICDFAIAKAKQPI